MVVGSYYLLCSGSRRSFSGAALSMAGVAPVDMLLFMLLWLFACFVVVVVLALVVVIAAELIHLRLLGLIIYCTVVDARAFQEQQCPVQLKA